MTTPAVDAGRFMCGPPTFFNGVGTARQLPGRAGPRCRLEQECRLAAGVVCRGDEDVGVEEEAVPHTEVGARALMRHSWSLPLPRLRLPRALPLGNTWQVRSGPLRAWPALLRESGIDPAPVLAECGLPADAFDDNENWLPFDRAMCVL
jgi:hypothetical protein